MENNYVRERSKLSTQGSRGGEVKVSNRAGSLGKRHWAEPEGGRRVSRAVSRTILVQGALDF
jgi:hypothetical protein